MSSRLKPWPNFDDNKEPITVTLARINHERGPFRHLTTESLQQELFTNSDNVSKEPEDDQKDVDETDDPKERTKSRLDKLYQAKREMQAHVASAQNEALMALDFVSLVLSKDMPRQADLTMSPFLKQQLKPATLGIDMWENMPADKARDTTDRTIAKGWRVEMLHRSADALLSAASRLETDVRKETEYWTQLLDIADSGWPILRMPRDRRTLGVRYGFPEATGEFKIRGMAALRPSDDDGLRLDTTPSKDARALRVRLVDADGRVLSQSQPPSRPLEQTMQDRIRQARDSIFEEELFHEMTRETRLMGHLGVQLDGSTINIAVQPQHSDSRPTDRILIDLVSSTADEGHLMRTDEASRPAQAAAVFARLLLCHAHRERLEKRSDPPPPISLQKQQPSFLSIIRPVLAIALHQSTIRRIEAYHQALVRLSANAGAEGFNVNRSADTLVDVVGRAESAEQIMSTVARAATDGVQSAFVIDLALDQTSNDGKGSRFSIEVKTVPEGSTFTIASTASKIDAERLTFSGLDATMRHLDHLTSVALARLASAKLLGEWRVDERTAVIHRLDAGIGAVRERIETISVAIGHVEQGVSEQNMPRYACKLTLASTGTSSSQNLEVEDGDGVALNRPTSWTSIEEKNDVRMGFMQAVMELERSCETV